MARTVAVRIFYLLCLLGTLVADYLFVLGKGENQVFAFLMATGLLASMPPPIRPYNPVRHVVWGLVACVLNSTLSLLAYWLFSHHG